MSLFPSLVRILCVTSFRIILSAWVGAAVLFVITSIAEQTYSRFDTVIRDELATIRFPHYYQFGFVAMGIAMAAGIGGISVTSGCQRKRLMAACVFCGLSLAGMAIDYQTVYLPLQKLIIPPGQVRDQEFIRLHERSAQINIAHISLALLAAGIACSPPRSESNATCGR